MTPADDIEWGVHWPGYGANRHQVLPLPDETRARQVAAERGLVIDGRTLVRRDSPDSPWTPVDDGDTHG
jgi:hypothetical protein